VQLSVNNKTFIETDFEFYCTEQNSFPRERSIPKAEFLVYFIVSSIIIPAGLK
jgi:hypothetical protein